MALSLAQSTATAGTDFSTVVSGFTADMVYRQLVNSVGGRYHLARVDDATMQLTAAGADLRAGVDTIIIETATGTTSGGTVRQSFDVTVSTVSPAAVPSLVVPPVSLGDTLNIVPTATGLPNTVRYEIRQAVSQRQIDVNRYGLTFDTVTGSLTGSLTGYRGFDLVVIVGMVGGQEVVRSRSFALYNPVSVATGAPVAPTGYVYLTDIDGAIETDIDGAYIMELL